MSPNAALTRDEPGTRIQVILEKIPQKWIKHFLHRTGQAVIHLIIISALVVNIDM